MRSVGGLRKSIHSTPWTDLQRSVMQRPKGNVELKRPPLLLTKRFAISGDLLHLTSKIMKKGRVDWLFQGF
jgi:hypothetical protein